MPANKKRQRGVSQREKIVWEQKIEGPSSFCFWCGHFPFSSIHVTADCFPLSAAMWFHMLIICHLHSRGGKGNRAWNHVIPKCVPKLWPPLPGQNIIKSTVFLAYLIRLQYYICVTLTFLVSVKGSPDHREL